MAEKTPEEKRREKCQQDTWLRKANVMLNIHKKEEEKKNAKKEGNGNR
jgi:hypothetical protein